MFIPVEDLEEKVEEGKQGLSTGERKIRKEREAREAKRRVQKEVDRWVRFYRDSDKYFEVGRVVGVEVEEQGRGQVPRLCDAAEKARPRRSQMGGEEEW